MAIRNVQARAGNTSENLLNDIRQNAFLLYWAKQVSKHVYNNLIKFVRV